MSTPMTPERRAGLRDLLDEVDRLNEIIEGMS